jgi:hypothetical protein
LFSVFRNCFRKQFVKSLFNEKTIENIMFLFSKTVFRNKNRNRFAKLALLVGVFSFVFSSGKNVIDVSYEVIFLYMKMPGNLIENISKCMVTC